MSGGFNTINKYKNLVNQQGITSNQNSLDSAAISVLSQAQMSQSIFSMTGNGSSYGSSNDSSEPKMTSAQKWAIAGAAIAGAAEIGMGIASMFVTNSVTGGGEKTGGSETPKAETVPTSNNLDAAINKFSKKGNDKTEANLSDEVNKAKTDKTELSKKYVQYDSAVRDNETKKVAAEDTLKIAKEGYNTAVTKSDKIKNDLIADAEAKINIINENDKEQDVTIATSNKSIETAKSDCATTISTQQSIISNNKDMASSTPEPQYGNGKVISYMPTQAEVASAKDAVANAEDAITKATAKKDAIIEKENGNIKIANGIKAKNAEERADLEAKKQNPSSDALTKAIKEAGVLAEKVADAEALVKSYKDAGAEAQKNLIAVNKQMVDISQKINTAEALLMQGPNEELKK